MTNVSAPLNMTHWCEFFAYDVMSDLGFSEDFGMLEEGKSHDFIGALHGATRFLTIASQTPWIKPVMWLLPVDKTAAECGRKFKSISMATYNRRKTRGTKQHDMFEYIASKSDGPRPLTESEIIADTSREWLCSMVAPQS